MRRKTTVRKLVKDFCALLGQSPIEVCCQAAADTTIETCILARYLFQGVKGVQNDIFEVCYWSISK